jgi:hypothetical protein
MKTTGAKGRIRPEHNAQVSSCFGADACHYSRRRHNTKHNLVAMIAEYLIALNNFCVNNTTIYVNLHKWQPTYKESKI